MQNDSYQTLDVAAADEVNRETSKPVYGTKRRTALKSVVMLGVCAACVILGVKIERHGYAQNVEGMVTSTILAQPVVSSSLTSPSRTGARNTNMRVAARPPVRGQRLRAEAKGTEGETAAEGEETKTSADAEEKGEEASEPVYKTSSGQMLDFQPKMSQAIPFIETPPHLDGTMIGDRGLDPFNMGADGRLERMREAEIKHARLAMLAAAGWPLSEKLDTPLANLVNLPVALNQDGTAPSPFTGGMNEISILYWGAVLGASAYIEFAGRNNPEAGDYSWDPLKLAEGKTVEEMRNMKEKEMKNGRLAMVAILGFAIQEALYKTPVTEETPAFFQPIWTTLGGGN